MKYKKLLILNAFLLVLAIIIKIFSGNASRVETRYSTSFYAGFSSSLRKLLGSIPFSIGDIIYGLITIYLLLKVIKYTKILYRKKTSSNGITRGLLKVVSIILLLYVFFNIFWGINYNRQGIAHQLGLTMDKYSLADLKEINSVLLQKVNSTKQRIVDDSMSYPSSKQLFERAQQSYALLDSVYPFLTYNNRSVKSSQWGWLGNYVGFLGYYNPLTGEAQVNTNIPKFLQPFTICHEIAHQLGYAKENEANFVGYLAASASADSLFRYSVYLDLFLYSNRNLFISDSASAIANIKQLLPAVKNDLNKWKEFNKKFKNPVEPVVRWLYGKFLESNEQPQGILSYDEVTSFIIAYYKKFGKL